MYVPFDGGNNIQKEREKMKESQGAWNKGCTWKKLKSVCLGSEVNFGSQKQKSCSINHLYNDNNR